MRVIGYVYLAGCLFAGTTLSEFKGRLTEGATASYDGLVVEVTNLQDRTIREHVDVSSDGSFGFRPIPDGSYQVRVLTRYGDEITSALTSIGPSALPFEIRLPQAALSKPVAGTVSIQQLNHPHSRHVQKLLESGRQLEREHNYDAAAARFREAARDAPNSVQAHADLGLALSNLRQWDSAADEYRAAIALDPKSSLLHCNLGAALAASGHFDEAGKEASTALKLDPRNARAHFVMAGVVLQKQGPLSQIVSHLVAAQEVIPSARAAVAKICAANRVEGCP